MFKASYCKLASVLPVKTVSHHLISTGIITVGEEEVIERISTSKERASYVLRKIAGLLEAGLTQSFYTLLELMKNHGGDVAVLAEQICNQLYCSSGDNNSNCCTYVRTYVCIYTFY